MSQVDIETWEEFQEEEQKEKDQQQINQNQDVTQQQQQNNNNQKTNGDIFNTSSSDDDSLFIDDSDSEIDEQILQMEENSINFKISEGESSINFSDSNTNLQDNIKKDKKPLQLNQNNSENNITNQQYQQPFDLNQFLTGEYQMDSKTIKICEEELVHFITTQLFAKISVQHEFSDTVFTYLSDPLRIQIGHKNQKIVDFIYNKFKQYISNNEFGIIESKFQDIEQLLKHKNIKKIKDQKHYIQVCNYQSVKQAALGLQDKFGINDLINYFKIPLQEQTKHIDSQQQLQENKQQEPFWLIIGSKNNFSHIYEQVHDSIIHFEQLYLIQ